MHANGARLACERILAVTFNLSPKYIAKYWSVGWLYKNLGSYCNKP